MTGNRWVTNSGTVEENDAPNQAAWAVDWASWIVGKVGGNDQGTLGSGPNSGSFLINPSSNPAGNLALANQTSGNSSLDSAFIVGPNSQLVVGPNNTTGFSNIKTQFDFPTGSNVIIQGVLTVIQANTSSLNPTSILTIGKGLQILTSNPYLSITKGGLLQTRGQADSIVAIDGTVNIGGGATLQLGTPTAPTYQTLTIWGTLSLDEKSTVITPA